MKTYGELITIDTISDAIIQAYNKYDNNFDDFVSRLQHHSAKYLWLDICSNIIANGDKRTIEKYHRKCKDIFRKYTNSIISIIESTKTRNVCLPVQYVEQNEQIKNATFSDVSKNDYDLDFFYNDVKKEETW
jgi:hypothetical protein